MQEVIKHKMSQMKLYGMHRAYQTLMETGQQHALTNDEAISHSFNQNGKKGKAVKLTGI